MKIETTSEQANLFFKSICNRRGFSYKNEGENFEIEVRPGYKVTGTYDSSSLVFNWQPILTAAQKEKFKSMFGKEYIEPTPQKGKSKHR